MADKIQIKRGNLVDLAALDDGELAFTVDTQQLFAGFSGTNYLVSETINASINTNLTTMTAGQPIILTNVLWDTTGSYNPSTGRFTAPFPGVYQFVLRSIYSSVESDIHLLTNSTTSTYFGYSPLAGNGRAICIGDLRLNTDDYVDVISGASGTFNDASGVLDIKRVVN